MPTVSVAVVDAESDPEVVEAADLTLSGPDGGAGAAWPGWPWPSERRARPEPPTTWLPDAGQRAASSWSWSQSTGWRARMSVRSSSALAARSAASMSRAWARPLPSPTRRTG